MKDSYSEYIKSSYKSKKKAAQQKNGQKKWTGTSQKRITNNQYTYEKVLNFINHQGARN